MVIAAGSPRSPRGAAHCSVRGCGPAARPRDCRGRARRRRRSSSGTRPTEKNLSGQCLGARTARYLLNPRASLSTARSLSTSDFTCLPTTMSTDASVSVNFSRARPPALAGVTTTDGGHLPLGISAGHSDSTPPGELRSRRQSRKVPARESLVTRTIPYCLQLLDDDAGQIW